MADEIYINTGSTFQQPYNARQPANAQQPYIANAQQPYPYIANAQQPYIANAQQPYPYIANGQQPYIANARSPFTYSRQAQQPYPYIVNARSPFTYQVPFITQQPYTFNARTPFTYQAQGRVPASAQQPYTFSARRPAVGRIPYIYAGDTSYVGSNGISYARHEIRSSGTASATTLIVVFATYIDATTIALKLYRPSIWSGGGYFNTSNTYVSSTNPPYYVIPEPDNGTSTTTGTLYKIEDVASGYSVRYTINSTFGGTVGNANISQYTSSPANAGMTTTAQSISTSVSRGVQFSLGVLAGNGEYEADSIEWDVTFTFEKSGSTTFSKNMDIEAIAEADSFS